MPPVIGAAIAAGVSTYLAQATMAYFVKAFVLNLVMGYAAKALAPKPKTPDIQVRGRDSQFKQPITNHDIVYGEIRQSGPLVYVESTDDDKFLHMIIALAGHEVEAIDTIIFNDEELTLDGNGFVTAPSKYVVDGESLIRVKKATGSPDQVADADLIAESDGLWTNAHRLREIAYIYVRLQFNSDAFPNGIPNISAIVRGKKLFDNRDGTTVFSSNAALVLLDYLRNSDYGLGCSDDEIDFDSFDDAADICDDDVELANTLDEKRYECHGVIDTGDTPKTNIEKLLTSMGGQLVYSSGKFVVLPASYRTPTRTITLDEIIGDIAVQTRTSRRAGYNAVKGVFVSPDTNYQPTDYPAITSVTFEEVDNNEQKFLDLELPFTTSATMAQRIAKAILFRERQQIGVQIRCNLSVIDTRVGDTINLTIPRLGFDSKNFEVMNLEIAPNTDGLGIDLTLQETSAAVYQWTAEEQDFETDNTSLPNPFDVLAPGISVSDDLRAFNESATTVLIVDVTASNEFTTQFEVQAKEQSAASFVNLGQASGNRFELPNVEDGSDMVVRARAINSLGIKSPFTEVTHNVQGKFAPPTDVTNFKVNISGTEAHLSWTAVDDLDLSHYRIRHASETSSASYSNSQDIARKVSRPATSVVVPAKTGTYFIKAIDKLGIASTNAASSVAIINRVETGNVVQTVTESPSFTGTKTNCEVDSGALVITSGNSSGVYNFSTTVDLGAKYQFRALSNITVQRLDRSNLFDSAGGLFDSREGLFDGTVADFDDYDTEVQFRVTDDDPSGSPTWSEYRTFEISEVAARAIQFRLLLSGDSTNVSPQVTDLSVVVDMPDRVIAESDIDSGASAKSITFTPAFKSLGGIGIAASNLSSGEYFQITNKTTSGFTITFFDSSDTIIDRTFDFVARGFGEVI